MASVTLSPENIVNKIQEALRYHKSGNFDEALRLYDEVIPLVTGKVASQLCGNAGALYLQQGNAEIAVKRFEQAIEATPEHAESHFNLAVTLNSKLNKQVLAIKHCRLAMKYDPKMHKAYHLMGNILQDIGKPEEAGRYFSLAERIANNSLDETDPSSSVSQAPQSQPQSRHVQYQNLWIWNAQLDHTYRFEKITDREWQRSDITSSSPLVTSTCAEEPNNVTTLEMTCLSERPLIFEIPLLLSNGECEHILSRAEPLLQSSHVMGEGANSYSQSETRVNEPYRQSVNAWLSRDDVLVQMQSRVAILAGLPLSYVQMMSEDLQVIRYDSQGQFRLHQDSSQFHPRLLTALVYLHSLTDEEEQVGGETWFPFAPGRKDRNENEESLRSIDEAMNSVQEEIQDEQRFPERRPTKGLAVSPRRGKALLFFNHLPDGRIDPAALHSGRKLLSGTKWAANYWIKFDPDRLDQIAH